MQIMIVNPRFFRDKPEVIRGIICTNEKNKSKTLPQGKQGNPSLIVMFVQIIEEVFSGNGISGLSYFTLIATKMCNMC